MFVFKKSKLKIILLIKKKKKGADLICNFLESNKSVVELYLYDTQITDDGAKKLEAALGKNKTLKRLDLNDNHIAKELKSKINEILLKR